MRDLVGFGGILLGETGRERNNNKHQRNLTIQNSAERLGCIRPSFPVQIVSTLTWTFDRAEEIKKIHN